VLKTTNEANRQAVEIRNLKMWADRVEAKHDLTDGLAEPLRKARERVLRGSTDDELRDKIKNLGTELNGRSPSGASLTA
jgi:hypothetical protein